MLGLDVAGKYQLVYNSCQNETLIEMIFLTKIEINYIDEALL